MPSAVTFDLRRRRHGLGRPSYATCHFLDAARDDGGCKRHATHLKHPEEEKKKDDDGLLVEIIRT